MLRIFGEHPPSIFAAIMAEFGRTGRIEYRHAFGVLITGFFSLSAGGSIGPEGPLADASGGFGTWLAERLKVSDQGQRAFTFSGLTGMLGAFLTSPFAG